MWNGRRSSGNDQIEELRQVPGNRVADAARISEESGMEQPHRYPVIFNPKARSQKGGRVLRFLMNHANRLALYAKL